MNATKPTVVFIKSCPILNDREDLIVDFPSTENLFDHVIMLVLCVLLFFFCVILNGVSAVTISRSRILNEKISYFTVMVKSMIDFTFGLTITPQFIVLLATEIAGNPNCVAYLFAKKMGVFLFIYSVIALSAMNFERYTAIIHPVAHRNKFKKEIILAYLLLIGVFQTILFGLSFIFIHTLPFVLAATVLLLIASTIYVYTMIFVSRLRSWLGSSNATEPRKNEETEDKRRRLLRSIKSSKEFQVATNCFLIVILTLSFVLPATISYMDRSRIQPSFSAAVRRRCFALLILCNAALNPVMFFWKNKTLRTAAIKLLRGRKRELCVHV